MIALDAFATGLAVAGVTPPRDVKFDGVDLMPHLTGKVKTPPHERLFWRMRQESQVTHAVREDNWKAIRIGKKPVELYDLAADIAESKNLASEKPEVVERLTAAIDAWDKELAPSATTGKIPSGK